MPDQILQLEERASLALFRDRPQLRRLLGRLRQRLMEGKPHQHEMELLEKLLESSESTREKRTANLPEILFPEELPVSEHREQIKELINHHQVVVIAGETGSGKTTQIPKICLELGRGILGRIGHTQPRRIAARSVAQRIADELKTELGNTVGYQVRFHDQVGEASRIKLMTDGILLAEIQQDRDLLQYDTIIIDEAHERSLNIDFLLGYLRQLLPRRPDLKLIITSATIATERFSQHFNDAPVIEVSGRTYPVEVWYRELHAEDPDEEDRDMLQGILDAVDELSRIDRGDILVFLSGEREIRDTAEALRKHHPPDTEILPLFARLSVAEQNRIFQPHGRRRIVLATNVAETSLTVPGIRYVIDTGVARISRYSYRSKVQRLPIEKISQASANQRKGRCGRVSAGICVRLYSEEDFNQRSIYTDPEIQRTNLASVILNMKLLKLGDVEEFPFMDPPDRRYINDGYRLLHELGAVDEARNLTRQGREMSRFPVDPRIARMILEARNEQCLKEVLVIASALTIQDPRERPLDAQQKADLSHKEFLDDRSDFMSLLAIWNFYHEQARHLSQNKLRKLCHERFLAYRRMQEWHDLHKQLAGQVKELGACIHPEEASYDAIHRSLLAGLLGNIGFRTEEQEYVGSHGKKFLIFPGSGLRKKGPKWIMAAEMVETSRLYARMVAAIHPEWVEQLGNHLVKRTYGEAHWEKRAGQVGALEKVTLYGIVLASNRRVNYGPIDPVTSRMIFIRHALVYGEMESRAPFFLHNATLMEQVQEMEDKARRRDIQVDEQQLFDFYNEHIPQHIYSRAAFEKWWKKADKQSLASLYFEEKAVVRDEAKGISAEDFPDSIRVNGLQLRLQYHFSPGHDDDGVTVLVPLAALNQLQPQRFEWLVPGLLQEKLTQMIRTLPKSLRKNFVPAPDFAAACLGSMEFAQGDLYESFADQLRRITGIRLEREDWKEQELEAHLRMNFHVLDDKGKLIQRGRNLQQLQAELSGKARDTFIKTVTRDEKTHAFERDKITTWDFGELPEVLEINRQGIKLKAYPALNQEGDDLALRLFDDAQQARMAMRGGLRGLFTLEYRKDVEYIRKNLPGIQQMCLHYATLGSCDELKQELLRLVLDRVLFDPEPVIRNAAQFEALADHARKQLVESANEVCVIVGDLLREYHGFARKIGKNIHPAWISAIADLRMQVEKLVYPGFLHKVSYAFLQGYPRYFRAMQKRLEKLESNPARDRQMMLEIKPFWEDYLQAAGTNNGVDRLEKFHWMIEEFRVSLFAQELKTAFPVSAKRLQQQWKALSKT